MFKTKIENSNLIQYSNRQFIKDIWIFVQPYRWRFFVASLFRLISDIAALYPSYAFALVITFFSSYTFGTSLKYYWILGEYKYYQTYIKIFG